MDVRTKPRGARELRLGSLLALAAAVLAAGCAAPMNARQDTNYQEQAYTANRPVARPTRSISSFSESLSCMDYMLRSAELPTTLVTSKYIPDYSGKVSVATKEMVVTALSQMSRLSNAFRFVDYEVDIARQDTVQNLTTLMINTNQVQLQRPALYFSGAVSFVDQNVLVNRWDVGTSASRLDTAYSQNKNATIIGLEMHLGDFRTRTLIPGLDSANEVAVGAGGQGLDLAARIGKYGVEFNVGRDYNLGTGAAIRTLVELATIELVGKWAHVPYWQCLTLDQTHPHFQRMLQDWYNEGEKGTNAQMLKQSLVSRGYLRPEDLQAADGSPAVREAIGRFQADNGLVVSGTVDFPTYERALRDFVALNPDGTLARIGWTPAGTPTAVAAAPARPGAPTYGGPPPARTLDMQVENVKADRSTFESGEQIFISATVSRASYLACYYADSRGAVMRLLPNSSSPATWVSAGQAVRVPDWMSPNPGFVMDAGQAGMTEEVGCYATDGDRVPDNLRVAALTAIKGYSSLADLDKAYAEVWGPEGFTHNAVRWQVVPRRAAPPAAPAAK